MTEKLVEIFDKFKTREDNVLWDLELTPEGDGKIKILMETNDAYHYRPGIMKIKLEKIIGIDEEDYITKLHPNKFFQEPKKIKKTKKIKFDTSKTFQKYS